MSLRIFTAIRHSNDPKFFYGGLWPANFYPALRELGHEVIESQIDLLPLSRLMQVASNYTSEEVGLRAQITERILNEIRAVHQQRPIDLFLSYFYNSHFDPIGFTELRRLGIPTVNFYCNSIYQFELVSAIAAHVDFSWHTEREARNSYVAIGARPIWVQMGADPNVYFPVWNKVRQAKAVFIGQRYADRDRWMADLVRANVPIDIYGAGWTKDSSPKDREEFAYLGRKTSAPGTIASYRNLVITELQRTGLTGGLRRLKQRANYRRETNKIASLLRPYARGRANEVAIVFAEYELSVNFSNVWSDGRPGSQLIPHVRLRDFEAPMCRSTYLTGHSDEITEFYEVGREIDTYQTSEELIDKAKFYLTHPVDAEKLREAGYRRALYNHTWKCRFEELFRKIGLMQPN